MNKTTSTLNSPTPSKPLNPRQAKWVEDRSVFPIYLALAKQLEIEVPFPQEKRNLPEKPDLELFDEVELWLDEMDQRVAVHELRKLLQTTTLNANESSLCALIHRHLKKSSKTNVDRDKIDFLLVQYFALCAPAKIYHKQIEPSDVAQVMKQVLGDVDDTTLGWCEPLEQMIEKLRTFRSLREILKTNFIEQGRKVKETAGGMFYDPAALLAFVRFNFLLRRTFIELMHADLIAIRSGLAQLEAAGVKLIDCQNFGLSSAEPLPKIRETADEWKQPFQKDYTERSVNQTFEKLLGLRADVEKALGKLAPKPTENATPAAATAVLHARLSARMNVIAQALPSADRGNARRHPRPVRTFRRSRQDERKSLVSGEIPGSVPHERVRSVLPGVFPVHSDFRAEDEGQGRATRRAGSRCAARSHRHLAFETGLARCHRE